MSVTDHFKLIFDALCTIFETDAEGKKLHIQGGEHKSKKTYPALVVVPGKRRPVKEHTGRRRRIPIKVWYDFELYTFVDIHSEQNRALGSEGVTKQLARVLSVLQKSANKTISGTCEELDWGEADFDTLEGKVDFSHFILSCRRTEIE